MLVGEGPLGPALKIQAERLGIAARVAFTGFRNDVADILHAADLFVLTSLNEGMGRVLVEAMAAGLPVVAFADCAGVNQYVVDGRNGLMVDRSDGTRGLARALARAISDESLRRRLSRKGYEILELFGREAFRERWVNTIDAVVQRKRDP